MMSEFLVCAPTYFDVKYEINDWMKLRNKPDTLLAQRQWSYLHDRLIQSGANLRYILQEPDFPDMVFTANAGLVVDDRVILSNFKNEERRGEKKFFKSWFLKNGYQVIEIDENIFFEGAGDALFVNDILFMGYGFRTDIRSHKIIANALGVKHVSCELVNPRFYHLDTCFQHFSNGHAIFYPEAFKDNSLSAFSELFELIPVSESDANELACNAVVIEDTVIFPSENIDAIKAVENLGLTSKVANVSEFIKSGGACQCLVIALN